MLKTLVPTPFTDEIKITIFKLNLLNANLKLAIVAEFVFVINLILIIKSEKLFNPLIFNRN